ncbi:MAG: hypothetical protein NC908_01735 [Candidatus Omnitrophica bacterium]|nr:hypothetical protein [Candidatus Omnitrophota bacterium]
MSLKKVIACLKDNKSFLITSHQNPEADALGSEIALYILLKGMGKRVYIVNDDEYLLDTDFFLMHTR